MLEFDLILKLLVHFIHWKKVKQRYVKPLYKPKWLISMKRLGVLLLPPGWDANLSQGYPQNICCYPFVHLGAEKRCESKVSCLVNALQIARKAICCHYWICEASISSLIKIYVGSLCLLTPSKLRKMRSSCVAFLKSSEAMENKDQPSFPRVLIQSVVPYWNTKNNDDNKTLFIEGNTKHLQTNKLVAIKFQQIENWLTW